MKKAALLVGLMTAIGCNAGPPDTIANDGWYCTQVDGAHNSFGPSSCSDSLEDCERTQVFFEQTSLDDTTEGFTVSDCLLFDSYFESSITTIRFQTESDCEAYATARGETPSCIEIL